MAVPCLAHGGPGVATYLAYVETAYLTFLEPFVYGATCRRAWCDNPPPRRNRPWLFR